MSTRSEPFTELDSRFSSEDAQPTPWADTANRLEEAEVYWLSTVRSAGRPHVTPLLAVWFDDRIYFCTGPTEQKAHNLEHNGHCVLTTGSNELDSGLDVVVEGEAVRLTDEARLRSLATTYEDKYGSFWHFEVRDAAFHGEGGRALVYEVAPSRVFGFAKGRYGQTRYRFPQP
jgi:general stress protein 26